MGHGPFPSLNNEIRFNYMMVHTKGCHQTRLLGSKYYGNAVVAGLPVTPPEQRTAFT